MKWLWVASLGLLCCTTWVRGQDAAATYYNNGVAQLQSNQFTDAAKSFQTIIDGYPTFQQIDEVHLLAGQAYLFGGKFSEAVKALQKEADPKAGADFRAQGLYLTALAQFSDAQQQSTADKVDAAGYTTAIATLTTLIDYIKANPTPDNKTYLEQSLYYRSLANYEISKYDASEADLKTLTTDPAYSDSLSRPDYFLQLGDIYAVEASDALDAKKHPNGVQASDVHAAADKAIGAFETVVNDPNALVQANDASSAEAQIYLMLAELDNSSDGYQKALEAYRKVKRKADLIPAQQQHLEDLRKRQQQVLQQAASNPSSHSFSNQITYILTREQGKLDALQKAPDPIVDALINIAICYVNITGPDGKKESDEARTILRRLTVNKVPLTPDQQQKVDFYMLFSYVLGGQTDKAEAALTDYLTKHAGDPQADSISFQIAQELFKRKDYAGALTAVQRSIKDFPKGRYIADAITLEARILTSMGRIKESDAVVDEFLKSNPNSTQAYQMLLTRGTNKAANGDLAGALADFGKVRDATAAGAETQAGADLQYLQTLVKMKNFDAVLTEAKSFQAKFPTSKQMAYVDLFAAQALDAKSDPGAVAALQAVARKYPQDPPAIAPIALYAVVENYHRANNPTLMLQAAKDLSAACPTAFSQIILADDAVSDVLQKQNKYDDAAALYEALTKASDSAIAAQAQNKVGDVRFAQAKAFHYQSLPVPGPNVPPGSVTRDDAKKVLGEAEAAYVATLKNFPDELAAVGTAIEGLVNVAQRNHSWGVFKDEADYEPYLDQVSQGLASPEMKARFEMAKAGLVFVEKNGAAQFGTAMERFKKVVAANPGLRLTRQETEQFGDLLIDAKDYAGAQKVYQDLLDNSPASDAASLAVAYYGLGASALAQGQFAPAKDYFTKMEALPGGALWNKHHIDADLGIAYADEQSTAPADLAAAKQAYGQLMKSAAQQQRGDISAKAMIGYGRLLEKEGFAVKPAPQGPNESAVHYYQQPDTFFSTGTAEQSAEGLFDAGQAYDKAGDKANAKKMYDQILSVYKTVAPDWAAKAQAAEGQ